MQAKITPTEIPVEIPNDFLCPITLEIMTDPVVLFESGHTYEREVLLEHLKRKKTDPKTNKVISNEMITPNHTLKSMIQTFLDKQRAINPNIDHQTYLPKSLIETLLTALEKNDIVLFKETLKKDSRLLQKELKENKNIFMLACESGSLESLEVVMSELGDKVRQIKGVEGDQGLSVFLMLSRRLGLKGGSCIAKAIDWKPSRFQDVLVSSIQQNDTTMVSITLSLGAIATPELLNQAYAEKKTEIVKLLILSGVSIEGQDSEGHDFLMRTIADGYTVLTLFLISECVDRLNPNKLSFAQDTAFTMAVQKKQIEVVKALLNHPKLDLNQTNGQKDTALHLAVRNDDQTMVNVLMSKNISLNEKNAQNQTALDIAYQAYDKNDFSIVKHLFLSGAKREDLLFNAIENHQAELIEFLLTDAKAWVNPNLSDSKGQTALMLAVQKNQPKTVSLLLTQPTLNVNQMDTQGQTALHHAAMLGSNDLVKRLMKEHASIKDKNKDGKTPLQLARESRHKDLANWMEEKHRYKKVKPFLKPLQVKLEEQGKSAQEKIVLLEQENQQLREELAALKANVTTQKTNWEKFSMFSEKDTKSLMTVAEKQQQIEREQAEKQQQQQEEERQKKLIEAWFKGDLALVRKLESQGASLLGWNKGSLSDAQQVATTSKAVQGKINQNDLAALLKWVTEGHLVEVETLLKRAPILALGTGTVTDRSDRTFKNMTVLQYAAWALDAEMAELIIRYLGAHHTSIQLKALANEPECYGTHGASYDFSPLVTKTQTYVDNYSSWDRQKCAQYWQKEVGGEQRKCPAWLIYAWSEKVYTDPNCQIQRKYEKHHLDWWFTENYNGGRGVGSSWAAARTTYNSLFPHNSEVRAVWQGVGPRECLHFCNVSRGIEDSSRNRHGQGVDLQTWLTADLKFVSLVGKTRGETLQRLRATSDSQLMQSSIGFSKGQ